MKPQDKELWQRKNEAAYKDARAIIARDYSASRMNATKWREVIDAVGDLELRYRLRWVDVPDVSVWMRLWIPFPHSTYFDSGTVGPFRTFTIEWLEIDPIEKVSRGLLQEPAKIDHTEEVERRLDSINVAHQREGQNIRIMGYVRNTEQMR